MIAGRAARPLGLALEPPEQTHHSTEQGNLDLEHALALLRATLEATADAILVVDRAGRITAFNRRFAELWGLPEGILASGDDSKAVAQVLGQLKDPAGFAARIEELYARPEAEAFDVVEFRDGRVLERYSIPQRVGDAIVGRVVSFRDVTARREAEARLAHQALHDALTGLPNRALFQDRLKHALARSTRRREQPVVLLLDLDNFKAVNDTLGHGAGDELLVQVAGRLQATLRASDTIARLGGDEFAILLEDEHPRAAGRRVAERIGSALDSPFRVLSREISVRASVGIAHCSGAEVSSEELMRDADIAMYEAKRGGRGRSVGFDPAMREATLERRELEEDLRRAIETGDGLFLEYQPIFTVRLRELLGAEALVRWDHPKRGRLAPPVFVPLAEESGLIVPLGRWVMWEACRQAATWPAGRVPGLGISINISPVELEEPAFLRDLCQVLTETGLDPTRLTLEITERALMKDTEASIARLRAIKGLGVKVAIDDFGTGYSSLNHLRAFPADALKIDRSFVTPVASGTEGAAVARAIAQLAKTFRLATVAEGVETAEQFNELAALGCDAAQGHYLRPPLGSEEFRRIARDCLGNRPEPGLGRGRVPDARSLGPGRHVALT